jgi:anti-sigma factor RsiW
MSPLSCPDVEARLDLYAAGECDPAEADAVRRHLAECPRCAAACDEARQLVGLLDLRLQEPERLSRLESRIAAEERPARRVLRFPAALRRVAALAAMLLLTAGPVGLLLRDLPPAEFAVGLAVALREEPQRRGGAEAMLVPADVARGMPKGAPEVKLDLELRNTTDRPMRVWVAGPQTELRLELHGPGARSVPAKDRSEVKPRFVALRPGESYPIHVTGLSDSRRTWSWTEPGDYTLTAEFTTRAELAGLGGRRITVRSDPLTIPVPGP